MMLVERNAPDIHGCAVWVRLCLHNKVLRLFENSEVPRIQSLIKVFLRIVRSEVDILPESRKLQLCDNSDWTPLTRIGRAQLLIPKHL